jgi:hypothetical protein
MKIAHQITCPNPSPKPFSKSGKIVNLWPGQIPGKGQVQLRQGYKEKPLSTILCSLVQSAGVNMCLHPFDQKKLPCQDFLCFLCVCFWHQRVFNSNIGLWLYHSNAYFHFYITFSYVCEVSIIIKEFLVRIIVMTFKGHPDTILRFLT